MKQNQTLVQSRQGKNVQKNSGEKANRSSNQAPPGLTH